MINILNMISREKSSIEQELATLENERIKYCQEFFKKYRAETLDGALSTPPHEMATVIFVKNTKELSVEKIKELFSKNKSIFELEEYLDSKAFKSLVKGLAETADPYLYEKVKGEIASGERPGILEVLFSVEKSIAGVLYIISEQSGIEINELLELVNLFSENYKAFCTTFSILDNLKEIADKQQHHSEMYRKVGAEFTGERVKQKDAKAVAKRIISDNYNIELILRPLSQIFEECNSLKRKERIKALRKEKNTYEQLETTLYDKIAVKKAEFTEIGQLLKNVANADIRLAILKLVYTHNRDIYERLSAEYNELSANAATNYQVLLAKYGISPEMYEVGTVMVNSIEDLKQMLDLLLNLGFKTPQELLSVIQITNLDTVQKIRGLADRGIITGELLHTHQTIFSETSQEYENFMRNLNLITKKKLNPHAFTASEEVFVLPHERLSESFEALEDYELLANIKAGMNLSFLQEQNLPEAIDLLLELGYEKNLEECLELLNYKDRFERLKILKELNIPITDTTSLIDVLTTDKFYVPDAKISDYIYNAVPHNLPKVVEADESKKKVSDIARLSQFSQTSRTYDFNGVLISKNKVHRNLSHVLSTGNPQQRIIYGVLKGSTLSDQEVQKVVAALAPQKTANAANAKK